MTLTHHIFLSINKVTPRSPLPQAKETLLPQPFLLRKMLRSLNLKLDALFVPSSGGSEDTLRPAACACQVILVFW